MEAIPCRGRPREMVGRDMVSWSAPGTGETKCDNHVVSQTEKLGTSCDWRQGALYAPWTGCSVAVKEVFVRLYTTGP